MNPINHMGARWHCRLGSVLCLQTISEIGHLHDYASRCLCNTVATKAKHSSDMTLCKPRNFTQQTRVFLLAAELAGEGHL
jgi:hypothetical protein